MLCETAQSAGRPRPASTKTFFETDLCNPEGPFALTENRFVSPLRICRVVGSIGAYKLEMLRGRTQGNAVQKALSDRGSNTRMLAVPFLRITTMLCPERNVIETMSPSAPH